ncbi:MAG TPA: AgmX/PglI C-terminal domain-containing protein [Kofleriaceae bacterium]|nr:AgmX/PglI C-terminal domain-containing protein [Kofleriaceae bacterium]
MSTQDHILEGAKSIEVAAMLGDSVVDVKHCIDPTTGRVTPKTWAMFAAGVACVLASGIAFASSVHTASKNQRAFETWTRVDKKPAGAFRAELPGQGYDWVAFGGFAIGIGALAGGLARMRAEKQSPTYRIGTAPGVDMALDHAPAADFALVAPKGEDFVLNLGHGLAAEMMTNGQLVPVSATELPINAGARFRVRSGQTTFIVSAVPRPRRQAAPLLAALESRTLGYFAGSLAAHIGLWALLQMIPEDQGAAAVELGTQESVSMASNNTDHEQEVQKPDPPDDSDGGNDSGTMAIQGPSGQAGSEKSPNHDSSRQKIAKQNDNPQAARDEAIEMARREGILGDASLIHNGFNVDVSGVTSGFDDVSQYGAIYGADVEGYGHFGVGRSGFGPGGGCDHEPCGTIPGSGGYGTIGTGKHAGGEYGLGGDGHGPGLPGHHPGVPQPHFGTATAIGDYDKDIIRRYMRRNASKLQYCYEKQLLAHPGMAGEIQIQFFIMPNGAVNSSTAKGFDGEVASCVADVVGHIEFPAPNGGGVQVNYPLTFHAAGQ